MRHLANNHAALISSLRSHIIRGWLWELCVAPVPLLPEVHLACSEHTTPGVPRHCQSGTREMKAFHACHAEVEILNNIMPSLCTAAGMQGRVMWKSVLFAETLSHMP